MTRALEAFAALAVRENRPDQVVRLTAAASALRAAAGLPAVPGARLERYLDAARGHLDPPAIELLWAQGRALDTEAAVALALQDPASGGPALAAATPEGATPEGATPGGAAFEDVRLDVPAQPAASGLEAAASPLGALTPREREVVTLITRGCSNKAIAEELVISPATAARHVANILAKLGFTSRTQVAWWAADQQPAGPIASA
jgi:DNA-binding NarL/FixJ family response regulator